MDKSFKGDPSHPNPDQHWYEEALRRAGVMVFEQDDQLRYTRIFNPAPAFCGQECVGKTDEQIMDAEDARRLTRLKREVLDKGLPFTREVSIRVHGRRRYYTMAADPVRDAQGYITGIAGSFLDLTRQKQTERALNESEERFRVALHGSRTTVFSQDKMLRYTWVYNATPGFSLDDYLGKSDRDLYPGEWGEQMTGIKQQVMRTGKGARQEVIVAGGATDGDNLVLDLKVDPLTNGEGAIIGVIGAAIDITGRKKTEQALEWERELLATLFDSIPVMISLYDPSIENIQLNQAFHDITGWTAEDVQQHGTMQLVYPDEQYRSEVARYMQSLESGFKDLQMKTKEGRTIESSWANIRMPDGRQVGIGVDITQRVKAERALVETQEQFAAAFRASPDALIITHAETGEIMDVNDAWTRHWGYSRQESIGRHTIQLGMYLDPADRRRILTKAREKGYVDNYELQLRHRNGQVRQALFSVELMQLTGRQLLLSVIEDVTDARLTEQEREHLLEENRSQRIFLETLLENTKAGVAVVSGPELRFTMVNKAYQALCPDRPMVGQTYGEVFPGAVGAGAEDIVRQVVLTGQHYENTGYPMAIPGKRDATWDRHIVRLPHDEGQPPSALIITWDTTSHKRLADKLEEANRELEAFSYSVSHDLRNPLLTIGSFTRFLQDDYSQHLDEEGRDYLRRIIQGTTKMQQLIDDMLVLSRLGRQELHMEPLDLTGAIHQCLEELQLREPLRPLKATIEPGMQLQGDRRLIHLALENLLGNAWKYSKNKEIIQIEAGILQREDQPVFFIRDQGEGFRSQYARKIFEPFRRVHSDQEFPGSGVGLSIVQRVIHRHGGRIWARSSEGEGATFYFVMG